MNKIGTFADFCWEGLTLKHVVHKGIVIPYMIFFTIVLVFELFLVGLVIASSIWFTELDYAPNMLFYISTSTLLLMLLLTIPVLAITIKKYVKEV